MELVTRLMTSVIQLEEDMPELTKSEFHSELQLMTKLLQIKRLH